MHWQSLQVATRQRPKEFLFYVSLFFLAWGRLAILAPGRRGILA